LVNDWLVGPRGHVDEPIGGRRQIGKSDVYNFGSSVAAVAAVQGWGGGGTFLSYHYVYGSMCSFRTLGQVTRRERRKKQALLIVANMFCLQSPRAAHPLCPDQKLFFKFAIMI
jgi:hypothetical protein